MEFPDNHLALLACYKSQFSVSALAARDDTLAAASSLNHVSAVCFAMLRLILVQFG